MKREAEPLLLITEDGCAVFHYVTGQLDRIYDKSIQTCGGVSACVFVAPNSLYLSCEGRNIVEWYALDRDRTGISSMGKLFCGGADSQFLTASSHGQYIVSLSYHSGTVTCLALDGDMRDHDECYILEHTASPGKQGPDRFNQLWSHPASACFTEQEDYLLVADSGNDAVNVFRSGADRKLAHVSSMSVRPGCRPMEIVRGENDWFYLLSTGIEYLYACRFDRQKETLKIEKILSPLPYDYTGLDCSCGHLQYSEQSNRVMYYSRGMKKVAYADAEGEDFMWYDVPSPVTDIVCTGDADIIFYESTARVIRGETVTEYKLDVIPKAVCPMGRS